MLPIEENKNVRLLLKRKAIDIFKSLYLFFYLCSSKTQLLRYKIAFCLEILNEWEGSQN